ncbi:MAG: putative oxidoreductase [Candidatus Nitrotoga sp. LAW]|nr:MAG: putative oxidoreductase [Candidatus Nitrotoga sp. LAW]
MNQLSRLAKHYYKVSHLPEYLAPALDLGIRLFLANVFFKSGLTKIHNWDSTLYLFSDVYQVPLLPPELAAYLATSAELGLPVLLVMGLLGRFAAGGLFILNLVAVISFYSELSESGINQHLYWGMLLAVLLLISRGAWSLDELLEKRLQ